MVNICIPPLKKQKMWTFFFPVFISSQFLPKRKKQNKHRGCYSKPITHTHTQQNQIHFTSPTKFQFFFSISAISSDKSAPYPAPLSFLKNTRNIIRKREREIKLRKEKHDTKKEDAIHCFVVFFFCFNALVRWLTNKQRRKKTKTTTTRHTNFGNREIKGERYVKKKKN